jgi:TPR repeat protein|tara:strand:+ start:392 stop:658 length:267 start_codon:yes stop_codon:yes gene_type:complete
MAAKKSRYVALIEANAQCGDPASMELLSRRYFSGKGVDQSFEKSYYWSTIALNMGVTYLSGMNQFALTKLNKEEKTSVEADLERWPDH